METEDIIPNELKVLLKKQHYEFSGNHTAIKICEWAKKSLRDEGVCYKEQFYNIKSHLCCQMSPTINFCSHSCTFCWRPLEYKLDTKLKLKDRPKDIIDNCIEAQRKKLSGFWGNEKVNKKKLEEAQNVKHFAISLSGEPTFYPKLPELIKELKKRKMSSFLVTNGTNPKILKKLLEKKAEPTQLYITLPAPDEEIYNQTCNPSIKNGWKKINESLKLLKKFKRSVIRLTLVKGVNMFNPEKYVQLIEKSNPLFVECKSYMWVGHSQERLDIKNMPRHEEIVEFAKEIEKNSSYKIIDEKKESRVVLMMRKDFEGRKMEFEGL
ncbi:MAG: 4-demethylwyosine synthase TYW1 [Acidobacteria bacterium]|nr:4-demethylwyosine synthase TYW1 [Acidobacteriota bacterium]|tara:strand:+ start:29955 stop:30923 length:969 start_codon:yes stop_codon:yes gene_type:complete